ncbi:hypothetical protein CRUP_001800 [Coryphaenoides rupestris]|nr:hypothetical protein CRUP_001800 [Coryphaenoides rupestris]
MSPGIAGRHFETTEKAELGAPKATSTGETLGQEEESEASTSDQAPVSTPMSLHATETATPIPQTAQGAGRVSEPRPHLPGAALQSDPASPCRELSHRAHLRRRRRSYRKTEDAETLENEAPPPRWRCTPVVRGGGPGRPGAAQARRQPIVTAARAQKKKKKEEQQEEEPHEMVAVEEEEERGGGGGSSLDLVPQGRTTGHNAYTRAGSRHGSVRRPAQ